MTLLFTMSDCVCQWRRCLWGLNGKDFGSTDDVVFVGSHQVDLLITKGDSIIVVDKFFTWRKENMMHRFGTLDFILDLSSSVWLHGAFSIKEDFWEI